MRLLKTLKFETEDGFFEITQNKDNQDFINIGQSYLGGELTELTCTKQEAKLIAKALLELAEE